MKGQHQSETNKMVKIPQPYGYSKDKRTKKPPRDYLDSIHVNNEAKIQGITYQCFMGRHLNF